MLQLALDVEGDHPRTSGALSPHHVVLRVRGQACIGRERERRSGGDYSIFPLQWTSGGVPFHSRCVGMNTYTCIALSASLKVCKRAHLLQVIYSNPGVFAPLIKSPLFFFLQHAACEEMKLLLVGRGLSGHNHL